MADLSEHVESCPTTLKKYPHCCNAHGHQTWRGGDLPWEAPTLNSRDPLITWSCRIKYQSKTFISPLPQGHQIWQGGELHWEAPIHKVTWPWNHVVLRVHVTQTKSLISRLPLCQWQPKLAGWWLSLRGSYP